MTQQEFDALVTKVGAETAELIRKATEPLQQKLDEFEQKFKDGGAGPETIAEIKKAITDGDTALKAILGGQADIIAGLQQKIATQEADGESVYKVLEGKADEIKKVYNAGAGQVSINLGYQLKDGKYQLVAKAVDVHNTTITGANASLTESLTTAAILRAGSDSDRIETIRRTTPWILEFVSVGPTSAASITWFDEVPKQGDFAVTAEGAVKPMLLYTFNRTSAAYRKAAGRIKITEEFNNDFPRIVGTIENLMKVDCRNEMNDLILVDMIANASSYSNPVLVGQIDNADNYGAIAAVAGQLGNSYYTPNVLVMNNNQAFVSASQKGSDGQYINPEMILKEINSAGLNIIKHPSVAYDNFFLGDGSVYQVLLKGDLVVRIGYSNDDFDRNQYSLVVEQYFYSYIPESKKVGLVYASFADVKASIEMP